MDAHGLPTIVLCGPIAAAGTAARGGFQACNRRTIDALRAAGADVRELPFPEPRARGLRKLAAYALGFLRLYARLLRCRPGSIVHVTALSGVFIYLEWVIVRLAHLRGCKAIFDLRAGAALDNYRLRSSLYRRAFDRLARAADLCMVEGEPFLAFLDARARQAAVHLPNHIDTRRLPARADEPLPAAPTLIHAGRIVPEKGIEVALDACRALHAAGVPARLRVVGDGEAGYLQTLGGRSAGLPVEWLGPRTSDEVLALMAGAHFFIFPTRHFGEGQSNALTEALACGCVPIVSRHGFNETVIADAGVTLPAQAPAQAYADAVLSVWRDPDRWRRLSQAARERAERTFSTESVVAALIAQYARLAQASTPERRSGRASVSGA